MKARTQKIVALAITTIISTTVMDRTTAQFAPRRVYSNLIFDNQLAFYLKFPDRFYLSCKGNKASFQIYRSGADSPGRGIAQFVSSGEIWTNNCGPALDDGEGWLFRETKSSNGKLCQGRLQSFDGVWHFDKAVPGYQCDRIGKSFIIRESESVPQYR